MKLLRVKQNYTIQKAERLKRNYYATDMVYELPGWFVLISMLGLDVTPLIRLQLASSYYPSSHSPLS